MRVKLFGSREYKFTWPLLDPAPDSDHEPIPEGEKIVILCKRLDYGTKKRIEDSMITMRGSQLQRGAKAQSVGQLHLSYKLGSLKDQRLRGSVKGWENVLDEEGNPIKFSVEALRELLSINGGLPDDIYGLLETDLLTRIDEENSFAETSQVSAKNSATGPSNS